MPIKPSQSKLNNLTCSPKLLASLPSSNYAAGYVSLARAGYQKLIGNSTESSLIFKVIPKGNKVTLSNKNTTIEIDKALIPNDCICGEAPDLNVEFQIKADPTVNGGEKPRIYGAGLNRSRLSHYAHLDRTYSKMVASSFLVVSS